MNSVFLDTDVIIDYLRGVPEAVSYIESLIDPPRISVVVVAELYAGIREGAERIKLENILKSSTVIALSYAAAIRGGLLRRSFNKSHNVGLDDALIAATALLDDASLATLNRKHFPMLERVVVPYIKS